jgi:transposase
MNWSRTALHGVDVASLRKWVAGYEALGIAGIQQKRRQTYDLSFKLDVLQRMKADGLSCRQAGAIFNVRRCNSIAEWERAYSRDGIAGLIPHHAARRANRVSQVPAGPPKDTDQEVPSRQALLDELEVLRAENAYLKKLKALVQYQTSSAPGKMRKS